MIESDYDKIASQRDLRGAVCGRSARTVLLRGVFSNECLYSPTMGVVEIVKRVNLSLVGHYNYYGVTSNGRSINCFCYRTKKILFKVLNRRSQRKSYTWEKFNNLLKKFPLAKPKICVQLP